MDSESKLERNTKENQASGRRTLVEKLLGKVEEKFEKDSPKTTVADYIRLVQLSQELDDGEPREIKVTWIEAEETGPTEAPTEPKP